MKECKIVFLFVLSLLILASSVDSSFAVSNSTTAQDKQKYTSEKCVLIQSKISDTITNFDNGNKQHLNAFLNLESRLNKLELKLSDKGYDTTKLKSDMATLAVKVNTYSDDYGAFVVQLKTTQSLACGHSQGDFKVGLREARNLLTMARVDAADTKNYYKNNIKEDLLQIKEQTPTLTDDMDGSNAIPIMSGTTIQ